MCMPQFDSTRPIRTHKHIDRMNDFSYLEEFDDDDVRMSLFAQSLTS